MSISIIGIVGLPARYGGFETLVDNLLPSKKVSIVYCSSRFYNKRLSTYKNSSLKYIPLQANGIQSIAFDLIAILHSILFTKNDLLVLGVSGAIIFPFIKCFTSRFIVTNIDGIEWRRDKWGRFAKIFLKFSERLAVKYSDVVISDNQGIADYVYLEYDKSSKVIAYGGDHALLTDTVSGNGDFALGICRIEPENNVHIILEAFARTGHKIKFIGNWDNSEYGKLLLNKYSKYSNIDLLNPIYDKHILYDYRSKCKYYVHGHSAGGTNPSLVEIMFFSKQVIAFDCIYNRATLENNGLFFHDADSLVSIIQNICISFDSSVFREIASRRYTWSIVKKEYLSLFN